MIATSGFLAALECTKFVCGRGFVRTPLGSLQRSPRLYSWFKGPTSKREGQGRGGEEEGKGEFAAKRPIGLFPKSASYSLRAFSVLMAILY